MNLLLSQDKSLVHSQWLRAVNSREYRASVLAITKAVRKDGVFYWLADFTRLCTPNMHDQKWTAERLASTLCAAQLRKIAIVLPDDLFLEVVMEKMRERILQKIVNRVQIVFFSDCVQAYHWLDTHKDVEGLFRQEVDPK